MAGAMMRGLQFADMKEMTIGEIVDYCIVYNNINTPTDEKEEDKVTRATQADFDKF